MLSLSDSYIKLHTSYIPPLPFPSFTCPSLHLFFPPWLTELYRSFCILIPIFLSLSVCVSGLMSCTNKASLGPSPTSSNFHVNQNPREKKDWQNYTGLSVSQFPIFESVCVYFKLHCHAQTRPHWAPSPPQSRQLAL